MTAVRRRITSDSEDGFLTEDSAHLVLVFNPRFWQNFSGAARKSLSLEDLMSERMKSKELQEMEAADLEQEPSLDKMVDLNNPKVLEGLGHLAMRLPEERRIASAKAKEIADDLNRPETEEDGFRAEALRRLKVRRMFQAITDQTQD